MDIEIKTGQIWKRKGHENKLIKIGSSQLFRGLREWRLIPLYKGGRVSWKYDGLILHDLEFVCNDESELK